MTKRVAPLFANELNAARLFDMSAAQFLELVEAGHLPRPKNIAGYQRWDVEELQHIARGEAALGMEAVEW
jgi:hypothetical protein